MGTGGWRELIYEGHTRFSKDPGCQPEGETKTQAARFLLCAVGARARRRNVFVNAELGGSRRRDKTIGGRGARRESQRVSRRDKRTRPLSAIDRHIWQVQPRAITIGHKRRVHDFAQISDQPRRARSSAMLKPIKPHPAQGPSHQHSHWSCFTPTAHPDPSSLLRDGRRLRPARCRQLLLHAHSPSPETAGLPRLRHMRRHRAAPYRALQTLRWLRKSAYLHILATRLTCFSAPDDDPVLR